VRRRTYRDKVSGPVSDRIDITRHISPLRPYELHDPLSRPEPSSVVRARVERARARQAERYEGTPWGLNADVPGPEMWSRWPLDAAGAQVVDQAFYQGRLSRRGAVRVHRLAWSVADLWGLVEPDRDAVDVALRLRRGDALEASSLPVAAQ
jgi:magnesium chelatase family protein